MPSCNDGKAAQLKVSLSNCWHFSASLTPLSDSPSLIDKSYKILYRISYCEIQLIFCSSTSVHQNCYHLHTRITSHICSNSYSTTSLLFVVTLKWVDMTLTASRSGNKLEEFMKRIFVLQYHYCYLLFSINLKSPFERIIVRALSLANWIWFRFKKSDLQDGRMTYVIACNWL